VVIEETLLEAEEKMEKAVVFNKIVADYYGAPTPINQLASFSVPEPRMAVVTPFDKSALRNIEQAIRDSDLGVNPSNDGNIIRVVFPELTEERRRDYIKVAKSKGEDAKVSIRSVRRKAKDAIDKLVKDGEVGEDEGRRAEKELDDTTAKYVAQVDELLKHKEAELLEV
jgi:ribosome recycling factor